ncbi:MAG: hypothetical protein ACYDBB_00695 [Armatimonadota bacterium]
MRIIWVLGIIGLLSGITVGRPLVMNAKTIPAWKVPAENWQFYPINWQTQPLVPGEHGDCELAVTVTVGPYLTVDPPFETAHHARHMAIEQFVFQGGLVLRASGTRQYRLQLNARDGTIALWKTPENFLAAADVALIEGQPIRLVVRMIGPHITVFADGKQIIDVLDHIEPILRGRVMAGANHARMTFDKVKITRLPSPAVEPELPAHRPAFHVRSWCRARWIFDGAEPVARLGEGKDGKPWAGFPTSLYSAKLRPGTREADCIPLCYRVLGDWPEAPVAIITETPERLVLEARTSDRTPERTPTGTTVLRMTLTYDAAGDTYVYDVDSTVTYLTARKPIVEVLDPWPYGCVGPAYPQAPQWDQRYSYLLWRGEDGRFYRQPFNHYAIFGGLLSATQPEVVITGEADVNPRYELYGDSLKCRYYTGLCTVMFDQHVQPTRKETVAAGTTERFQWRESSVSGAEAARLLAESAWSVSEKVRDRICGLYFPTGTIFDPAQTIRLGDPTSVQLFAPPDYYTIDPTVGHAKPGSLRMEAAGATQLVNVRDGASPFGSPFDGRELELVAYVRTEGLDGTFTLNLETHPKPVKVVSPTFTGTTGWQRVVLRVRPQPTHYFVSITLALDAKRGAKGSVWIDDLSLLPVGKAGQK